MYDEGGTPLMTPDGYSSLTQGETIIKRQGSFIFFSSTTFIFYLFICTIL